MGVGGIFKFLGETIPHIFTAVTGQMFGTGQSPQRRKWLSRTENGVSVTECGSVCISGHLTVKEDHNFWGPDPVQDDIISLKCHAKSWTNSKQRWKSEQQIWYDSSFNESFKLFNSSELVGYLSMELINMEHCSSSLSYHTSFLFTLIHADKNLDINWTNQHFLPQWMKPAAA